MWLTLTARKQLDTAAVGFAFAVTVASAMGIDSAVSAQQSAVGPPPRPALWHPRIHFETDSAALSAEGREVARQVATAVKAVRAREVRIDAHADTLGPVEVNQALSERRAEAIARALVAHGVDPDIILAVGHGERRPAVPTGDAVSEPLNRGAYLDWSTAAWAATVRDLEECRRTLVGQRRCSPTDPFPPPPSRRP
jgi:hypothetical protein